jgi:hypothetical protein
MGASRQREIGGAPYASAAPNTANAHLFIDIHNYKAAAKSHAGKQPFFR